MLSTYVGRAALVLVVPFVAAIAATTACTDDTVRYGPPNGLQGKTPNDQLPGGDGGDNTSSSSSGSGEGGTGCTPPPADAGADCPTFTTMWTKYFAPTGEWKCGQSGCHAAGGQNPQPLTDQAASYNLLKTAKVTTGSTMPYFNPSCIEVSQSSVSCNIAKQPSPCGLAQMPSGITPSAASLADLAKWVGCGSPGP